MKKIILTVILLSATLSLHSQDYEPSPYSFTFTGISPHTISADLPEYKQTEFLLGWVWGSGKKMSEALNCNQAHVGFNANANQLKDNVLLVINPEKIFASGSGTTIMQCQAIQYEPTLHITNPGFFQTRDGDDTKPIFGFKYTKISFIPEHKIML